MELAPAQRRQQSRRHLGGGNRSKINAGAARHFDGQDKGESVVLETFPKDDLRYRLRKSKLTFPLPRRARKRMVSIGRNVPDRQLLAQTQPNLTLLMHGQHKSRKANKDLRRLNKSYFFLH